MSPVFPADTVTVDDVAARFDAIPPRVRRLPWLGSTARYIGAWNHAIPWPHYTSQVDNTLGLGEHFQGVQRIGRHLIVSGGITRRRHRSQLILIRMGSRNPEGPWTVPEYGEDYREPFLQDRLIDAVDIDAVRWHAGGIQAWADIVAVPVYGDQDEAPGSEVRYLRFDADAETFDPVSTLSRPHAHANAVALAAVDDDVLITAVWDDRNLEFHRSTSVDPLTFDERFARVEARDIGAGFAAGLDDPNAGTYQAINFIRATDGRMFLLATRNTKKTSPTVGGRDFADLYRVDWPGGLDAPPTVTFLRSRQFYCYNQQCNFGAGAGIYVEAPDRMWLYAVPHWLHGGNERFNFNEYAPE